MQEHDMPEKDPLSYELMTWAWVCALSAWGGIASYIRKVKVGVISRFSLFEIIGEIVISGFVGVLTFLLCEWSGIPQVLSAAIIGVSAHMGSRAMFAFETAADRAFQRWIGQKIN
jgi:hypothetical protein